MENHLSQRPTRARSKPQQAWLRNVVIFGVLLVSIPCPAATPEEKLDACDRALNAKIQEANLCDLGVKLRDNEIERVSKENSELRSRGTGLFDNPAVWAAVGVILGVYAGARATR